MPGIAPADVYDVIDIVNKDWWMFARNGLALTEVEIEQCMHADLHDLTEQRFQMVQTWMRKEGRLASVDRLYALTTKYREKKPRQHTTSRLSYTESPSPENQQENRPTPSNNAPISTPVSDIPNPMEKWDEKSRGNIFKHDMQDNYSLEAGAKLRIPRSGISKDVAPIKVFENEKPNEKRVHKRFESLTPSIFSSSASSSTPSGSFESIGKHPSKKGVLKKIKGLLKRGRNLTPEQEVSKAFSPEEDLNRNLCDVVYFDKVKPITPDDKSRILQISNRYRTEESRGCVLILNNRFSRDEQRTRHGSEYDVANMVNLWLQMGCDIYGGKPQEEKTADEMNILLKQMTKLKIRYSFVVVVIMTHGGLYEGNIFLKGVDNRDVSVPDIEKMFNNKNAPRLKNIPKFFIFQFCCGPDVDHGVKTDYGKIKRSFERLTSVQSVSRSDVVQTDGGRMPTYSDILYAYATHKGQAALRCPNNGSWFITAITNVFMNYACSEDLNHMLLRVNDAMKDKFGMYEDEVDGKVVKVKAMSWYGGSMTKQLFFLPGWQRK